MEDLERKINSILQCNGELSTVEITENIGKWDSRVYQLVRKMLKQMYIESKVETRKVGNANQWRLKN